eukprot:g25822.t1
MGNYRPINLTLVVGKILESVEKYEISKYSEVHDKVGQSQHGLIKGRSYLTNLLKFFEKLTSRLGKAGSMDIIYLEFKKAFDKVLHRRLLSKIRAPGVR